jgi:hypothetical protein
MALQRLIAFDLKVVDIHILPFVYFLSAFWSLDPTKSGTDEVTRNFIRTNQNGKISPTVGPCGYPNTAYNFDPSQQSFLQAPYSSKVSLQGSFTIAMMIRRKTARVMPLVEYGTTTGNIGLHFWLWPNPNTFFLRMPGLSGVNSALSAPLGKWTLVGVSYNAVDNKLLFIQDDKEEYKQIDKIRFLDRGYPLNIGARPREERLWYYFDGDISSVMIFNQFLTPKEIRMALPKCPKGKAMILSISKFSECFCRT